MLAFTLGQTRTLEPVDTMLHLDSAFRGTAPGVAAARARLRRRMRRLDAEIRARPRSNSTLLNSDLLAPSLMPDSMWI